MMDRVPAEIKRMIAFELRNCDEDLHGPLDIKRFRLVNKQFSIIGAEYLLKEIHLTFETPRALSDCEQSLNAQSTSKM